MPRVMWMVINHACRAFAALLLDVAFAFAPPFCFAPSLVSLASTTFRLFWLFFCDKTGTESVQLTAQRAPTPAAGSTAVNSHLLRLIHIGIHLIELTVAKISIAIVRFDVAHLALRPAECGQLSPVGPFKPR